MYENRVLRRMFGPKREAGEYYTTRRFIICTIHLILLG
jgi:hypothetical protein